jgi:hypothetical protein
MLIFKKEAIPFLKSLSFNRISGIPINSRSVDVAILVGWNKRLDARFAGSGSNIFCLCLLLKAFAGKYTPQHDDMTCQYCR